MDVATDREWKDKVTGKWKLVYDYVTVIAWNQEWMRREIRKGDLLVVKGRLQSSHKTDPQSGVKYRQIEVLAEYIKSISRYAFEKEKRARMTDELVSK